MKNINVLTTLFVGIDVSARTNVCLAMDFNSNVLLKLNVPNNQTGADTLKAKLLDLIQRYDFKTTIVALESTSFYGMHISNFLSADEELIPHNVYVHPLNPKMISNYRKSFIGLGKTDLIDAYIIADFARVGRITTEPWKGPQYLALQRLTRHRLHMAECITREKAYMVSNIFLKFSELAVLKESDHPFSSNHTATAEAILTEMLSLEDLIRLSSEELIEFVCSHSKNRYLNPEEVCKLLKKAARDSYRLDKTLYEPLTVSIASSFNCIETYEREIKSINKAIEKTLKGLCSDAFTVLQSIPGIGPIFASGILSEIGDIHAFHSADALAKYAGIYWNRHQSGAFEADNTSMVKAGNKYLRYYLIEATNSIRCHEPSFAAYYRKKYDESKTHNHKRALALTSRKTIRLIYSLLDKNQLYSANRVQITP
ncbi:IS110 family transposase [Anaerococcus sp. AGMB00486]|uniref:IS110 family transposase n=1 Tax=Anaerococcus faecalis TaxID=2742993 RepID=A0ABX2NAI8_9FIRM|nr:IS110 family transposase [Anaerococcus faecalis]NVF11726.1 IS110 family transposase [Anaerococcus faecalis]